MPGKTIVIGIGNTLLTDEGVGVRAVNAIKPAFSADQSIEFIDGGTLSFTLINYFDQNDNLIIIDATNLQLDSGSIKVFVGDEVKQFLEYYTPNSVHDVNLFDILCIARLMNRYPQNLALIAVQPEIMTWGTHLTQAVAEALPQIESDVSNLLDQWTKIYAQTYTNQVSE